MLRWARNETRDQPTRAFAHLHLAAGILTAGWVAETEDAVPVLLVVAPTGKTVYRTEGAFDALALDRDGRSLWTLEGSMLSRLSLRSLASGTATAPR